METLIPPFSRFALDVSEMISGQRLSILIFHRVRAATDPIFPEEPDAGRFEQLMRFVASTYNVMTLGRAITSLIEGKLPRRPLVITFDDGYADNAEIALPILTRHALTATFFVSTGFLNGGRMWNDSVIECVRASKQFNLDLSDYGLGKCSLSGHEERRATIDKLLQYIKYLSLAQRETAIALLQKLTGVGQLPSKLMMSSDQVRALHHAGMEIGAHTVWHPILAALNTAESESEIRASKSCLESIIQDPVEVFAYPNGKLVKRLGFRGAVSTAVGIARPGNDLFQLPRFTPWDRNLPLWAMRLILNRWHTEFDLASPTISCR
jgi:peptidoglycan/xylan/chitin deacetylase (PgdA/CDA1 family)